MERSTSRDFDGVRAAVIGMGATGLAAGRALGLHGASVVLMPGWSVPNEHWADAAGDTDIELANGPFDVANLAGTDLIIASPNVPERTPPILWARERGLTVWSELELASRLCDIPFVAITGTNGKSTTTKIVAEAMRFAGLDAVACGDVRYPFSTAATERHDALAVEVASSQLHYTTTLRPAVSVLLNLAPDHLDWHRSFDAYAAAKARVFHRQGEVDVHVGNRDDRAAAEISRLAETNLCWFGGGPPEAGEVGLEDGAVVSRLDGVRADFGRPRHLGPGGALDAAAAVAAALSFGLPAEAVGRAVSETGALPHRGDDAGCVRGTRFIDNSKATNPHAALAAVDDVGPCVLIAGGDSKGIDLGSLALVARSLEGVVAIGRATAEIEGIFGDAVPVERATSMQEAVTTAWGFARASRTVLLAPACASTDMYRDYAERGQAFQAAVSTLSASLNGRG